MQVTETLNEGLKREFKIVLPAGDIDRKLESRLKEFGQTARIPGFRPGKAPLQLLKTRYGEAFRSEVLQEAVNDGSTRTISERGLRPAMQPQVEVQSAAPGADLAFTVKVEVLPEIKPMDFRQVSLQRDEVTVADEDVEKELVRRAERVKRSEPVSPPRPAAQGDVVVLDFKGVVDGKPLPGGQADGYHLELGSKSFIPGFEDQVAGASVGEKRTVKVKFPDDYGNEGLRGKDATFETEIKEIRAPKPAAVDEEMAKNFGHETLAAMREAVRKEIEGAFIGLSRSRLKRKLFDTLTDGHDFPLPPGMVDSEFENIWRQIEEDKKADRLDESDKAKSEDELKAEYRKIAERRVRLGLLLSEVGRANNISVDAEEFNRALVAEARRYPGGERQVIEFYQKHPHMAEALKAPILEDKVVDFILEMAKIEKRSITAEEFAKGDDDEDGKDEGKGEAKKPRRKAKAKDGS